MAGKYRIWVFLVVATVIWMPLLHLFFKPDVDEYLPSTERGVPLKTQQLINRFLVDWKGAGALESDQVRMRAINPEWDFMGRTFLALALANAALVDEEARADLLTVLDYVIENTLQLEEQRGHAYFLLGYAAEEPWKNGEARSIFVDGEIALAMAARRMVEEHAGYREDMARRIPAMVAQMKASPVLCAESYPDECWTFCNSIAIAAIQLHVVLGNTAYQSFIDEWLVTAKQKLVEPSTKMLMSSFDLKGTLEQGPEGSSIWMAIHCLEIVDQEFARAQYQRAKDELGASFLGFGYAKEWPKSYMGSVDVDSGPIVPLLEISPSSSAMALLAAVTVGDHAYARGLLTSLEFAAFSHTKGDRRRFLASNQVGDAMAVYAVLNTPLWDEVKRRR